MSFIVHAALEDFGMKPVAGVKISVAPAYETVARVGGVVYTDTAEGITDATGQCDLTVPSIPNTVWLCHSTGRFDLVFTDPGEGATFNLADAQQVPADATTTQTDALVTAIAGLTAINTETATAAAQTAAAMQVLATSSAVPDASPVAGSPHAVTSGGVYTALDAHVKSVTPHPAYDDMTDLSALYRALAS